MTEQDAAASFAKIYTMAIAQGIAQIQWFEAQDPIGEDQGFGLLKRDGSARASYTTLKTLTALLGPTPKPLGWLALGHEGRGYGFAFEGKSGPVLVAWMPAGRTDKTVSFATDVEVTDAVGSKSKHVKAGQVLELTDSPVLFVGLSDELVKQAASNAGRNFPWGGDFSKAKTVSIETASPDANKGISQVGRAECPTVKFPDGSGGILVQGDINHAVRFYVHPSFASFKTKDYYIRATVRRVSAGNVGMNLLYEVADSQGRMPYANSGKWGGFSNDTGWQTQTWHVTDACFSKMWGYDLMLRPEQSVPFVIGKVEVSTEPFQ